MSATVAVIAARKRGEIFERLRLHGAVSPATARTLAGLELRDNATFRMQLREGTVIPIGAGRYFLDQEVVARRERHRRLLLSGLMWLLALVLVAYLLVTRL